MTAGIQSPRSDQTAAAAIAREVRTSGDGYILIAARSLAALFLLSALDQRGCERILRALDAEDLDCPELRTRAGGLIERQVTVVKKGTKVPPALRRVDVADVIADPVSPAQVLAEEALGLPFAVAAAASVAVGLILAPLAGWLPVMLLLAAGLAALLSLLRWRTYWVARVFYVPLPSRRLSAALLGVVPAALVSVLILVVTVPWVDGHRESQARQRGGELVAQADQAIAQGDRETARRLLVSAASESRESPGIGDSRARLREADEAAALLAANEETYREARRLEASRRWAGALRLYQSIRETRDSKTRAGRTATRLVALQLSEARRALAAGRYDAAISKARASLEVRPSSKAQRLISSAQSAKSRARARSQARARARSEARARERAERRRQAAAAAAAEQAAQDAADAASSAPSSDGGGSGYAGMNCDEIGHSFPVEPGSDPEHDRDNDGLACESQ